MNTEKYRQTILKTLQDYVSIPHKYRNINYQLIISEDRNDYLIMIYGTHNTESIHKCIFHLQIKEHKIVILRDNTKSDIFDKLLDAGFSSDRIIYPDLSQKEIQDFDLNISLEKIYEEYSSLFEVKPNFEKAIKLDATEAELIELAKIEHEYINCAIAQHPNTPPNLLRELFIKYPVQVLTNPILDLLLLEQPEFINNLYDRYSHYFQRQGLEKRDNIRKWAISQKEQNLYFDKINNNIFSKFYTNKITGKRRYSIMQNLGKYARLPLNTKNNPQELIESLDIFLSDFFGDRKIKYKPDLKALEARTLPLPLKYLYSFIGKYPGLQSQDTLLNGNYINLGKRLFLGENQGVWHCATKIEGNDPPVWINPDRYSSQPFHVWEYVCDSLAEFLVTYCLREAVIGSSYRLNLGDNIEEIISTVKQKNLEINLLWQGVYAWNIDFKERYKLNSFYLVEDSILISNIRCGTNYKNAYQLFNS